MEKIEYKLIESESECARLSDIVLTEIPQLKEELAVRNFTCNHHAHLYIIFDSLTSLLSTMLEYKHGEISNRNAISPHQEEQSAIGSDRVWYERTVQWYFLQQRWQWPQILR